MKTSSLILKTKLFPPRMKSTVIRRQKVFKKLRMIEDYPLTLVHSGPGFGKSTAVSSFFRNEKMAYCWYSISPEDDLVPFILYTIHAIRTVIPSFAQDLENSILNRDEVVKEDNVFVIGSHVINELLLFREELTVVFDDFHLVEHSQGIQQWLLWLLQHLPDHIHILLISRKRPKWDMLASMKVKGQLLELSEHDLALTAEEIDVLFSDYYEFPLQQEEIESIINKTEGWVIAIQMIWQQLSEGEPLVKILQNRTSSMDDLFSFLAKEVLLKQSDKNKEFLLKTSILSELNPSVCNWLLGFDDSTSILDAIADMNLFISPIGDTQYRYHALFKDFLVNELKKDKVKYEQLHERAAEYYLTKGMEELAIYHYKEMRALTKIAEILHQYGKTMIEQGKLESLLDYLSELPQEDKDQFYLLWIYEGEAYRYRSQYDKGLQCYKRGERLAENNRDVPGRAYGLEGQARIYLDTIQPGTADEFLHQAITLLESIDEASKEQKVRLYGLMAENSINLGRAVEAENWYTKCTELTPNYHVKELEARLYLRTGRLPQVVRLLELHDGRHNHHSVLPQAHRESDALLSITYAFMGEAEKAKRYAQASIMNGIKLKAPFVEACGWIRMGHAAQLSPKYDFKMALECYETALNMMEQMNISRGKAEPLMGLCLLYGREKSLELALKHGEMALEETERVKDLWLSTWIRFCMGISYVYSARWEEASSLFSVSEKGFLQCGERYGLTLLHMWLSFIAFETGQNERFETHIKDFLERLREEKQDFIAMKRTVFSPRDIRKLIPLYLEAQRKGIEAKYVAYLLESFGLQHATSHPGYTLRVKTLGQFEVWLGDKEVEDKDWQRGKAKELFQLFITKRRMLPKDEILGLLWPEMDEEAANRDFKVAMNALNKALEPSRTARSNPYFVQKQGSSYGIFEEDGIEIDVMEFESNVLKGIESSDQQESEKRLIMGLELYAGDYLPEGRYEDWVVEERERLQVLFLKGAEKLCQLSVQQEKYDQAIYWSEQILGKDACWEEAYRILIISYIQKNNRSLALRWLQRCRERLLQELGVQPMPETEKLMGLITSL